MNLLLFSKVLILGVVCVPFLDEAEGNIAACSPLNTNIAIDAQVPGEISTPVFPNGSPGSSCIWVIQAPGNFRVEITLKALKLNGQDDYLIIRDGADTTSPVIGKYGSCVIGALTLFSSGSSVFLQTVTAVSSVNDKLKIAYRPIDSDEIECTPQPSFCGINTELKQLSGVLTSPNFPNNYNADETCSWTIVAPPGYRVQFAIQFLGIEDHRYSRPGSCGDDSIIISELRGDTTRDVKVLCGCNELFSFASFENEMFLRFSSYRKNNWPGFYASYKALAPEECPADKTNCLQASTGPLGFNAQGQVCKAPSPVPKSYDGGNVTLDSEAKIQVDCRPDYIEVSLQISDFLGLAVNDSVLHLEDKACVASYKDNSMVKFTFGLESCMTEQEDDGEKIYYMNKVYLKAGQPADDEAITRVHTEIIPFKCGYDKKAVISKVSYSPGTTLVITDTDGFGNFTYFMNMYEDESNNVTVTEFPKVIGLGQKMYFGFRVESGDSELVVFPDVCKATTSPSFDSTPLHLIIEDACSRDNTLDYQYEKSAEQFFSFSAFRFKEGYDDVYIHCKLTVCRTDDAGSRCDRGCDSARRRRRSTEKDLSVQLSVGPLQTKHITSKEYAKKNNNSGTESNDSLVMIIGVVVGVLGTVAIGLIVAVIIISQRRRSSRKEQILIVSDDS